MIDIQTYLNRITSQHKTKPNFMALLAARLRPFIDLAECLGTFGAAFDLDNAVGNQLDIIGKYVGVDRLLNFQPEYAPSAMLNDAYYRMLLKVRISQNNWDGTTEGIQRIWGGVFPEYAIVIVDNQDMTINIRITGLSAPFISELIRHGYIVPKSMGVLVNFIYLQTYEFYEVIAAQEAAVFQSEAVLRDFYPWPGRTYDGSLRYASSVRYGGLMRYDGKHGYDGGPYPDTPKYGSEAECEIFLFGVSQLLEEMVFAKHTYGESGMAYDGSFRYGADSAVVEVPAIQTKRVVYYDGALQYTGTYYGSEVNYA